MNTPTKERRRFFRIEDKINLFYKIVDEQTVKSVHYMSDDVLSNCSLAAALDALSEEGKVAAARLERGDHEVLAYLKILDAKINLIAQALMSQHADFAEHDTHNVNLSASGIAFDADEKIPENSFLEIKIMLTSCLAVIVAYGQVIYCKKNPSDSESPYQIGVDYVEMKEDDRELLIKHVVKKQMQHIRETKKPNSATDE